MGYVRGILLLGLLAPFLSAQTKAPVGVILSHPDWPQPRVSDVDSVEHILAAVDAVISGPGKSPRDWDRLRSLFVPDARLIPVRVVRGTPNPHTAPATDLLYFSLDDYVTRVGPQMAAQDFYEKVTHVEVQEYGNIVQVFSTFESRHELADKEPFDRGIDSVQLLKDSGRYWIVDLFYNTRLTDQPIPVRYLPVSGNDTRKVNQNLTGDWVGQLEYRDFQTNERVFLPTWLTMTPSADGHSVTLAYTYDDGPGKVVREESTLMILADAASATLTSSGDHTSETYAVAGLEEFVKSNRGTLTLTGPGRENNKPVDVKMTVTLKRNLFTLVKETRPTGAGEYKFQDGYTFTRASVPKS